MSKQIVKASSNGMTLTLNRCQLSSKGFHAPDNLSYKEWESVGAQLKFIEGCVQWWIGDWLNYGERKYGEKYSQALESTEKEYDTLNAMRWVSSNFEFVRRRTNLSWSHHKEVAALSEEEQEELLDKAEKEGLNRNELRDEVRKAKREAARNPESLKGKYEVIYADPPWQYGDTGIGLESYGHAERHYSTMSLSELIEMPIRALSADNAVLFLWATQPMLADALSLIEAWGFFNKAAFIWDKVSHNFGHYNSVRHELLLLNIKGSFLPQTKKLFDSVVSIKKSKKHSEKPDYFYEVIEEMYPSSKRIELFARKSRTGWRCWGDQLNVD